MEKNITGKVYMITSPTGRRYIGSTKNNIKTRWAHYKTLNCKGQTKLYHSFLKHGVDQHSFEVIWEGAVEMMYKMERHYGEEFDVLNEHNGLNLKLPGYEDIPAIVSEETRKKEQRFS